jgi:hypothetical protein
MGKRRYFVIKGTVLKEMVLNSSIYNPLNLLKYTSFLIVLLPVFSSAQVKKTAAVSYVNTSVDIPSKIIRSTSADSAVVKIEMTDAQYDILKNNIPYYLISKRTEYHLSAVPTLIVKKTRKVTATESEIVNKYFKKFITNEFILTPLLSLSGNSNLNQYRYTPFRLTNSGEIEELLAFDVDWKTETNQFAKTRSQTATFKSNSVLASGKWYKIGIVNSGLHKLDANFFAAMGISVSSVDPRKIRIYGNSGLQVPEANSAFRYDDLEENSIMVMGENDGNFDPNDFVVFYAKDNVKWKRGFGPGLKFNYERSTYSDSTFYYLNFDIGNGKRVTTQSSLTGTVGTSSSSYDYLNFHESDLSNFMKSGRQFFGEYFDVTNNYTFSFNDGNFVVGDSLICETWLAGRGNTGTVFNIVGNGLNYNVTTPPVDVSNYLAPYCDVAYTNQAVSNQNAGVINVSVTKSTSGNVGWLDKITVNARRNLAAGNQYNFRDCRVCFPGNKNKYSISNPGNSFVMVWNVSDYIHPYLQSLVTNGTNVEFVAAADSLMEYALVTDQAYQIPRYMGTVPNQNLHAIQQADYVIVTHPLFRSQANRLANLHALNEGLTYAVVTTEEVYNEFGSGMADASAIRDFTRMLYSRNILANKAPKYLLLFGDGSYNNKNLNITQNSALIPTYQSPYSTAPLVSVATDDFYGLMDPNEGLSAENAGSMDVGVGRIVSRSAQEAEDVTQKIEHYYKKEPEYKIADPEPGNCNLGEESVYGDWKNWMIFLADDEDYCTHMGDADKLAIQVAATNPYLNLEKIYLDAYQQYSTPGGQRYPDAYTDLNRRIKKGALIFNYTGHGGEVGLTGERLIDLETINGWTNKSKLGLFVTATCEFTRYDDPGRTSAGELCLLNPNGGAVGLFTTCRLAFSHSNLALSTALYTFMFKKLPDGRRPCLGDILRRTKDTLNQSFNYCNFHLIGDPAVTLSTPPERVIASMINTNSVVLTSSDTLRALQKITVKGYIADTLGNKLTNFNGAVFPTIFDKALQVTCLLNDAASYYISPGAPFSFQTQKNMLYRGKAEVRNGEFYFTFIVPKDINFAYGKGKISFYATDGVQEAMGAYTRIVVGGGASNPVTDDTGPTVDIFLNDKRFVNGGITNEKPILYAGLVDSSGINVIGSSIGHDITAVLDGDASKPVILNDYYEASLNSYQAGRIRYPFDELPEGNHNMAFKVWDIQNNSSTVNVDFVVAPSAEIALKHVLNYPNPFTTRTKFFIEHNQACNPIKVTIQVFTISGKLVKTLQQTFTCEGFRPDGVEWDGKDDFGDKLARGVYVYRVSVVNSDNKKAEKTEKLVILN